MNYAKIYTFDTVDGPGVRVTLFVSGCSHRCPGCFNEGLWDYDAGKPYTFAEELAILNAAESEHIAGLSILGGEPLDPRNRREVLALCKSFKERYPDKTIWLYTGYTWEWVKDMVGLEYVDILVDGRFVEAKKDLTLRFRGSSNQRIIDVQASKNRKNLTLWEG